MLAIEYKQRYPELADSEAEACERRDTLVDDLAVGRVKLGPRLRSVVLPTSHKGRARLCYALPDGWRQDERWPFMIGYFDHGFRFGLPEPEKYATWQVASIMFEGDGWVELQRMSD